MNRCFTVFAACLAIFLSDGLDEGEPQPAAPPNKGPSFNAMQMTGKPDTPQAGDYPTCWAAKTSDGGKVWIDLSYPELVFPSQVWIYENCAPGAVFQVTGIDDGQEFQLWRGLDPTPRTASKGISKIKISTQRKLQRIRIYLDTRSVPGWNEIDCVGLLDQQHQMHWAISAKASSDYSRNDSIPFVDPFADPKEELREKVELLTERINQQSQSLLSLKQQVRHQEESLQKLRRDLSQLIQRVRDEDR